MIDKSKYVSVIKSGVQDSLSVELFDTKQFEAYPQVKVTRFDNEANLSVRLSNIVPDFSSIDVVDGDVIKYVSGDCECHFKHVSSNIDHPDGGIDFDVVLQKEPSDREVLFSIVGKCITFLYQAPFDKLYRIGDVLDDRKIGKVTPLEVFDESGRLITTRETESNVGSYAIYYRECPPNISGRKLYRSGKLGHIYYPSIIDSNGMVVRAESFSINYDEKSDTGVCKIVIPRNLVYPVLVDPTIGYDTLGASTAAISADIIYASGISTAVDGSGGAATVIHFGAKLSAGGTSAAWQGGIYDCQSTRVLQDPQTATAVVNSTTKGWFDSVFTDGPVLEASTDYFTCVILDYNASHVINYAYDSGTTGDSRSWSSGITYNTWPATLVTGSASSRKISIYAEYESESPSASWFGTMGG